ncbi:hypothetical protein TWF703_005756 [Orbilia oligospora]|uniref:Uncharacterized protein n=1 Tax=Orbilia oligospora TaxID=2813651 RepID=A0A7C8NYN2_ORBOL|nr:hypothetical protein TWF703_005756 [Orbilia oligospora]
MRSDTPTTQKVVAGSIRAPGPSPWMDVGESTTRAQDYNPSRIPPPPPPNIQPIPTSPTLSIPKNVNTTFVNNEYKTTIQNEERLERRMTDLSLTTDTKSPMYQEHVCAEDFYKQPRSVYENAVIVAKSIVETQALENREIQQGRNEDGERRASGSWRFESEVVWNEGGRSGYYENTEGEKKLENEAVQSSMPKMETQSAEQTKSIGGNAQQERRSDTEVLVRKSTENSNRSVREQEEGSKDGRGRETTIPATTPDQLNIPPEGNSRTTVSQPPLEIVDHVLQARGSRPQNFVGKSIGLDGNQTLGETKIRHGTEISLDRKEIRLDTDEVRIGGKEIRRALESNSSGWKYAFELFELGKVPDSRAFLVDVLGKFISRRSRYWEGIKKQGFNVDEYRKSDDDDLFLQISYTDAALESLRKGDTIRAMELVLKVMPVLGRRIAKKRSWILNIEVIEVLILLFYIPLKHSKQPLLKSMEDDNNVFHRMGLTQFVDVDYFLILANERTGIGLKWCFQLHFLFAMLLDVDKRYSYSSNKWGLWLDALTDSPHLREPLRKIVVKMFGIEALRYETEAAVTGARSNWSSRQGVKWLQNVSAAHLYLFASWGHQEMILESLETLYNLQTVVGWNGTTLPRPSPRLPKLPEIQNVLQVMPQSRNQLSLAKYSEAQAPDSAGRLGERGEYPPAPRRQGSIRHPSPWESGLSSSSSSQVQPRKASNRSISDLESSAPLSPRSQLSSARSQSISYSSTGDWVMGPSVRNISTPTAPPLPLPYPRTVPSAEDKKLKSQRLANLRDQPVRYVDDCGDEELNVVTDYKRAVRNSQNLDVYIGTLASLRLINFISGDPDYRPWTPLIEAICNQRWEAAKTLIRLGASFDLGSPFHTTLSRHFMSGSRSRCEKLVEMKLVNTGGLSVDLYFFKESMTLIDYMIAAGADINAVGTANTDQVSQIKTYPLHLAALDAVPNSSLVLKLLEMGAVVWAADANGEFAVEYARRAGNENTIKLLEEAMKQK